MGTNLIETSCDNFALIVPDRSCWTMEALCIKSLIFLFVFVIYSKQKGYIKILELLCFWKSSENRSDIFLL